MALGGNLKKQRLIPEKEDKGLVKKVKTTKPKKQVPKKSTKTEGAIKKAPVKKVVKKASLISDQVAVVSEKLSVTETQETARYVGKETLTNRTELRQKYVTEIAALGDKTLQLIAFNIEDEVFALDIHRVREVVATPVPAKVPGMPAYFKGIVNIRGKTVMALDLNEKLGLVPLIKSPYIMVVKTTHLPIGILLKELPNALKVNGNTISASLKTLSRSAHEVFIKGLIKLENQLVFYLDVDELVNSDKAVEFPRELVKK